MLIIDSYAYSSKFAKVEPKAKIIFSFTTLFLCLILNSISVSVITIIFMGFMVIKYSKVTFLKYLKFLLIPLAFLFLSSVTIIINQFTYGALLFALSLILKGLATVSCVYFLTFNTPMLSILQTLEKLHLPKVLVNLMELMYRYIFIVIDEAERIKIAQSSRLGYRGFKSTISCLGILASGLFIRSFNRADRVYSSLEARCYNGSITTVEESYEKAPVIYIVTFFFSLILIVTYRLTL